MTISLEAKSFFKKYLFLITSQILLRDLKSIIKTFFKIKWSNLSLITSKVNFSAKLHLLLDA